ncbi:MAG TPA: hypothetical protein PKY30_08325 [Myxococcota bacterium]|nr:hypothetical protein [Myxococcota bacterium]HNH47029.1 hypothetical protein [Myxococcota bacterium]
MGTLLLAGLLWAEPGEQAALQERRHLIRLGAWAGTSALGGTVILVAGRKDPFYRHLGIQSIGWSLINGAIVAASWKGTEEAKTAEQRAWSREFVNLNLGLDVAYMGVGITLTWTGLQEPQRRGLAGAGLGISIQGAALLILDAILLAQYPKP